MSFDHKKLNAVSRELSLEHGWSMPDGLADSSKRDPKNFTLEQWQQAKRVGKDAPAIKTAFADAWSISDSKAAFIHAMRERGYVVARGDRRGFVAVDVRGEIYSIPRYADVKTKAVRRRLGDENDLPSVDQAKAQIANDMLPAFDRFKDELDKQARARDAEFEKRRKALVKRQRAERQSLNELQEKRRTEGNGIRQARFRKGIKGLWDRLRGEHRRIREDNEHGAKKELAKNRTEKDELTFRHLDQRRQLEIFRIQVRRGYTRERRWLDREARLYTSMRLRDGPEL